MTATPPDILAKAFLQFFFIEIRRRFSDLRFDLRNAVFDFFSVAVAFNDRRFVLRNANLTGRAEVFHRNAVKFAAYVFCDDSSAGEDSDILKHCFAAVAEARSLNGNGSEGAGAC